MSIKGGCYCGDVRYEAKEEIQVLEEQMSLNYELPVDIMIG